FGSINGFAKLPAVRDACAKTVQLSSGKELNYVDSRGLNEALNGDSKDAIADFTLYADSKVGTPAARRLRKDWAAALETQDPAQIFTPDLLKKLIAGWPNVITPPKQP
ncbi:MAG: hypothetical protein JO097_16600, partial [Acidobacteriaceae bacterium]|nr:hypothetical protein [Acidobacteriaceae bacterium]